LRPANAHVDNPDFIKKRKVEMILERDYPDYYSKYSLVTFRPDLPYEKAMNIGRAQDQYIIEALKAENPETVDMSSFFNELKEKFIQSYQ
jgi:kynurenine 3-monooxygenase